MKLREILAVQIDRLMRVAPLVNMVLLVGNVGLIAAGALAWRGVNFYVVVILVGLVATGLGVGFANLWAVRLNMIHACRAAAAYHDPMQVYQFTPWERVVWRSAMIPQMENQAALAEKQGVDSRDLRERIERLKRWEKLGYIPREDYPEDMAQFYFSGGSP